MELYFKQYGAGPPLVVLHGLLGSSGNWHTLSSKVFGQRFTVYTVDQRNHGRSPHDDRIDYPSMVADLAAFLDGQGLGRVHLLGHSMGGKTAMHLALAHPERVARLVVVDIAPKAYPPHHTVLLDALGALDLAAYRNRQEVDEALADRIKSPAVRQFLLKNLSFDPDARRFGWLMNLEALVRHYDDLNAGIDPGRTFDGPTLFVRGTGSDYLSDDDYGPIRQLFPRAQFALIPSGHWVHAEAPDAFARVVMDFLTAQAEG